MLLGLLGNGIGRSRAKNPHELIGSQLGRPVRYRPMDLEGRSDVSIDAELSRCAREGFTGVNVTHPYKSAAFDAVDRTESLPVGLTAINTVVFSAAGRAGCNTDYTGFCRAFRSEFGNQARPGRVLLVGAGGVGKAVAFALSALGADELVIHDARRAATAELLDALVDSGGRVRAVAGDMVAEMRAADALINATPVGMRQHPGSAFPRAGIGAQTWAFDAVYTPEATEFVTACRERGIDTLSGFKLFLYQGLDAWERFSGIPADAAGIERAFLERYPSPD